MPLPLPRRRCARAALALATVASPLAAQTTPPVPTGQWLVTIRQDELELAIPMTFQAARGGGWEAFSRVGVAARMAGRAQAAVGGLLGKLPVHGALTRFEDGTAVQDGDTVRLRATLASLGLGNRPATGAFTPGHIHGELRRDSAGPVIATFDAVPATDTRPPRDYAALGREIRRAFGEYLYDPHLLETPRWRDFLDELEHDLALASDDAEAMAAFYRLKPRLQISHLELARVPATAGLPLDSLLALDAKESPGVTLAFIAPDVAYLRVRRWASATVAVDSAFVRIDSAKVHTLVLDIRGNPGGDASSIAPFAHLVREPAPAGVFLGRGWYATHRTPPTPDQLRALPTLTNDGSATTVIHGIRERGAIVGMVTPRAPYFGGRVYALIDRGTGSASEPLAHLLRASGRATLIGENTAGAMLSAPPHGVGQGFLLILPEADYFTADGVRLEGRGVAPHLASPPRDALAVVADSLAATSPYAAALVRGASRGEAGRLPEAIAAYEEARRLAPDSVAPLRAIGTVQQQLKAWDAAFDAFKAILARNPQDAAALYQFGRTSALSGQRADEGIAALRAYLAMPPIAGQPSHAAAQWRLGMIYEAAGRTAEARAAYEAAVGEEPGSAEYRAALARISR
ncbi:MAG TPA: S41 family peptidase [Longimicrobiaceae bacterium]|nr:S41 family peptidase [Longimicrobiaceae bacterium]